jgi:hypothetical protein
VRSSGIIVAATATVALSGCGGGTRQDASGPSGNFPVDVAAATFPASQRIAEHTHLVVAVRNSGTKTIPNVAVTITNPVSGTAADVFGYVVKTTGSTKGLASRSRPVWVIDQGPGACLYSCQYGGAGGAITAYSGTWALGALKPGATATFNWGVTAVRSGTYQIEYRVAAGLNGKAEAVLSDGSRPVGTFKVTIHGAPEQSYVNNQGQVIVTSP